MSTDKNKTPVEDQTTALATIGSTELAGYSYDEDEGRGYENQTSRDKSLPWMTLLQSGSPVVKEEVPGARAGCWMNTLTREIYDRDRGFLFMCVTTANKVAIWVPRNKGGGFRGHMAIDDKEFEAAKKRNRDSGEKFGKYSSEDGELNYKDTFYTWGLVCDDSGQPVGYACIAWDSTKIKPYQQWQTRMDGLIVPGRLDPNTGRKTKPSKPPMWAHLTRIRAEFDNSKGSDQSFWKPLVSAANPAGMMASLIPMTDDRYVMAKGLLAMLESGAAKTDYAKSVTDDEPEAATDVM